MYIFIITTKSFTFSNTGHFSFFSVLPHTPLLRHSIIVTFFLILYEILPVPAFYKVSPSRTTSSAIIIFANHPVDNNHLYTRI